MKFAFIMGLFLASSVGHASNLVGSWDYSRRSCLSGAIPNPTIQEPVGTVTFTSVDMTMTGPANSGCTFVIGPVPVEISATKISSKSPNATMVVSCPSGAYSLEVESFDAGYVIAGNTLSVTTSPGVLENGICPKGDSQIIDFVRVN